jgi:tetratricopeptide (TPR) repeat protein
MNSGDGAAAVRAAQSHAFLHNGVGTALAAAVDAVETKPMIAMALALAGDAAGARRIADSTPAGCYACQISRAAAAVAAKDWARADFWFAHATALAPSLPFAYTDWGAMLLGEGKHDAAIAQFRDANLKGPHFADPLEMWGEALMQENRSDLALAKFEEADKYAPNWGRLHLEWGEALFYAGKTDEARKRFERAAALDLPAADKASLAKWITLHG